MTDSIHEVISAASNLGKTILVRMLDGTINFSYGVEELYGWSVKESTGQVSHSLLRTQFPEPLETIEAKLVNEGFWEGILVHTTRDGSRIKVLSRWELHGDENDVPPIVIEINRRIFQDDERAWRQIGLKSVGTAICSKVNTPLLLSLYLLELSFLAVILALYRLSSKPTLSSILSGQSSRLLLVGSVGVLLSGASFVYVTVQSRRISWKQTKFTVAMNLIVLICTLPLGELFLRFISVPTKAGTMVGGLRLLPRSWEDMVVRHQAVLKKASSQPRFIIHDPLLGWTNGPNGVSMNGRNYADGDGIRRSHPAVPKRSEPPIYRIALIGDSFAFGQEVSYEDSWGHQLEVNLGQGFEVLNFGVMGYGVDQAYLRYLRDVRRWRPDVVILQLNTHDLVRDLMAYHFLSLPESELPFAKPRFVRKGTKFQLVNVPVPSPEEIISKESVTDLPFLEYDVGYIAGEWEQPYWKFFYNSYLFRFLISWYPTWSIPNEHTSDDAMESLGKELLHSFTQQAKSAGSTPIVVEFPQPFEFPDSAHYERAGALKVLHNAGIEFTDLTPCLSKLIPSHRFNVWGNHYSPQANAAVAGCLHQVVLSHLPGPKPASGDRQPLPQVPSERFYNLILADETADKGLSSRVAHQRSSGA